MSSTVAAIDPSWAWLALGGGSLLWIAALMACERFVLIMPSYGVLIVAGATASARPGGLTASFIAALLGSLLGGWLWYQLGRWVGPDRVQQFLTRRGGWIGMRHSSYLRLCSALEKRARVSTLVAQWIPGVRMFATFPVGVLGLPARSLTPWFVAGACGWNGSLLMLGWYFGSQEIASPWQLAWISTLVLLVELLIAAALLFIRRAWLRRHTQNPCPGQNQGQNQELPGNPSEQQTSDLSYNSAARAAESMPAIPSARR